MPKVKEKTSPKGALKNFERYPVVREMDIDDLTPALWNYKHDATPEQLEKLCESIKRDKSPGVLPVRHIPGKKKNIPLRDF